MSNRTGQQLGNYRLLRPLGGGSFAEVYLAQHLRLKTHAAIKVLRIHVAEENVTYFQREAELIASLVHPHIVRVFDFDVQDGVAFLVMDYALQGSLRQQHPIGSFVPLPTIVSYVKQVATALQYAHDHKLIHRDVKPENMLFGSNNEVLLSDFGIATVAHRTSTQNIQEVAGTALYMAPEQFQGKPRPASDQYALGVVVYEWLCGTVPFSEGNFWQLGFQHINNPPPPLHARLPSISSDVEQVVLTALAKDPKQRFAKVQAFAVALEQASLAAQAHVLIPDEGSSSASQAPQSSVQLDLVVELMQQNDILTPVDTPPQPHELTPSPRKEESTRPTTTPPVQLGLQDKIFISPKASRTTHRVISSFSVVRSGAREAVKGLSRVKVIVLITLILLLLGSGGLLYFPVSRYYSHLQATATAATIAATTIAEARATATAAASAYARAIAANGIMFGFDAQHTHANPYEHVLNATNVTGLVQDWTMSTGSDIASSPAVADGVVYVGSYDTYLYAFYASTGKLLWKAPTSPDNRIFSSPAVADGVVYVGSYDHNLYAFYASTGKLLWKAPTDLPIESSPVVANHIVYVGSDDHNLYAFNARTGAVLWQASVGQSAFSSPAVAHGVVYLGSFDGYLYAFNAGGCGKPSCAPIWTAPTGGHISFSSPAVDSGIVYIGSDDGYLYAFNAITGKRWWKAMIGDRIASSPAVANGVVYIGSDDGYLYAFDAKTDASIWTASTGNGDSIFSSSAVANGVVYVGSNGGPHSGSPHDHKLYAFDAKTGARLWTYTIGKDIYSSPAVANGVVYVGSSDHKLYAFHLPGMTP